VLHLHVVLADCGVDHRRKGAPVMTMQWSQRFPRGGHQTSNRFQSLAEERKLMKVLGKTA